MFTGLVEKVGVVESLKSGRLTNSKLFSASLARLFLNSLKAFMTSKSLSFM